MDDIRCHPHGSGKGVYLGLQRIYGKYSVRILSQAGLYGDHSETPPHQHLETGWGAVLLHLAL